MMTRTSPQGIGGARYLHDEDKSPSSTTYKGTGVLLTPTGVWGDSSTITLSESLEYPGSTVRIEAPNSTPTVASESSSQFTTTIGIPTNSRPITDNVAELSYIDGKWHFHETE